MSDVDHRLLSFSRLVIGLTLLLPVACSARSKPEVLIYYANETFLDQPATANYQVLDQWLRSDIRNDRALKIADQLARDKREFPHFVAEEIADIKAAASHSPSQRIALFTNQLAHEGMYERLDVGQREFIKRPWSVPRSTNYMANSFALANDAAFFAALRQVSVDWPPSHYQYTLVTKSHGNSDFAMVPRFTVRNEESSPQELMGLIERQGRGDFSRLPSWVNRLGVRKATYFATLAKAGRDLGMYFKLVYAEACKSRIGIEETASLPGNIAVVVAPHIKMEYRTLDYRYLLLKSLDGRYAAVLEGELAKKFPNDFARRRELKLSVRLSHAAPFYLPLLVMAFLLGRRRYRQSSRAPQH